ncbi:hypothetical protein DUNSADRAFT_12721 [Dunaliella salina]|uniref:Protein BIG1 n=1 Tax=Dunaliella salina TaxID=3046 RepID=A0ABQ7GAR1_DUNSA|nr:hypothetical protein DUNSADRAFT_12721 [Dunaliella salina]|eukprot:KAF5831699.1 hypothetical protein DUNSADRAFT_12721 [Dunaliella salina]
MMGAYRVLPFFLGALTLCQASPDVSPLMAWVTHRAPNSPQHTKVLYHQENAQASILDLLTKGWSGSSLLVQGQHPTSTIVLFLGSQLDTAALSRTSELGQIVERAQSSVVLPYALSVKEDILKDLGAANVPLQAFGCKEKESQEAIVSELRSAMQGQQSTGDQPRVFVVCATPAAESPSGRSALEAELRLLVSVQEQLEEQGAPSMVICATQQSPARQGSSDSRRSVLSEGKGFGPYKECGQLCQTQVKWLQGILAFLFMAVAAGAGMTCLSMLDTPSRFEKPKEGGSAS